MKKKNLNFLLALLAALALVFAGACDTGTNGGSSSSDENENNNNNEDETPSQTITANAEHIKALLDGITTEVESGITDESDDTVNWAFQSGSGGSTSGWDASTGTYTLLLADSDTASSTEQPILDTALGSVQALGNVADNERSITVSFGSATAASGDTQAAAGNQYDYRITVPVTVGEETVSITIVLKYETVSTATGGWLAHTAVTRSQVEELLQEISTITANSNSESWSFGSGTLAFDATDGYTFTVTGSFTNSPSAATTQTNLRGAGSSNDGVITKDGNPCTVSLGSVTVTKPETAVDGVYSTSFAVTVSIVSSAQDSYSLPAGLASVTIVLNSGSTQWATDV